MLHDGVNRPRGRIKVGQAMALVDDSAQSALNFPPTTCTRVGMKREIITINLDEEPSSLKTKNRVEHASSLVAKFILSVTTLP